MDLCLLWQMSAAYSLLHCTKQNFPLRCLRRLEIGHLAPKLQDLTDKSRALRIISALDDKISAKYKVPTAARRVRVVSLHILPHATVLLSSCLLLFSCQLLFRICQWHCCTLLKYPFKPAPVLSRSLMLWLISTWSPSAIASLLQDEGLSSTSPCMVIVYLHAVANVLILYPARSCVFPDFYCSWVNICSSFISSAHDVTFPSPLFIFNHHYNMWAPIFTKVF